MSYVYISYVLLVYLLVAFIINLPPVNKNKGYGPENSKLYFRSLGPIYARFILYTSLLLFGYFLVKSYPEIKNLTAAKEVVLYTVK